MTLTRTHVLNLEPGDRFCFSADGPIYRVADTGERGVWIVDDRETLPPHRLEWQNCFVHAIDPFTIRRLDGSASE